MEVAFVASILSAVKLEDYSTKPLGVCPVSLREKLPDITTGRAKVSVWDVARTLAKSGSDSIAGYEQ